MRQSDRNRLLERCAEIADKRAVVCAEAVARYMADKEEGIATTERCARREAEYIACQIRTLKKPE